MSSKPEVFNHTSVMLNECIEGLNIKPDGIYVDGTFGGGGHASEILKKLEGGKVVGIDKDAFAYAFAFEKFSTDKLILVKDDFSNIANILNDLSIEKVDGMLLDLGVSSYQLDSIERGFSYRFNSPLDMRMNQEQKLSAKDVVNSYSEKELTDILYKYGEENLARRIVKNIMIAREKAPIATTGELVDIINNSYGYIGKRSHATKTFQAIRIEVNGELRVLEQTILDIVDALKVGGRLAIITFHSLEDRIVKQTFNRLAASCICDKNIPICVCNNVPKVKIITKKPITPSETELKQNKRSSSAKLRVLEKL